MHSNQPIEYDRVLELIDQLERMYSPLMDSETYHGESIADVLEYTFDYIDTFDQDMVDLEVKTLENKASPLMGELCILFNIVQFNDIAFSEFEGFPSAVELSMISFRFTSKSYNDKSTAVEDKKYLAILTMLEQDYSQYKLSLPYRTFKLLYLFRVFGCDVYVSILVKFTLQQFATLLVQRAER